MPIEMPKGLPFSVDTWSPASDQKRHHFLTHAHWDHMAGLGAHFSYPVYATRLTKSLVLHYFPQLDESVFVEIEIGKTIVAKDPEGDFKVTAYDANHCPGAVMFLFEGTFGNILHTGDCRLTKDTVENLPTKYIPNKKDIENIAQLDYVFLDCTFGRCSLEFPTKKAAIQQVKNCIKMHPNAQVVYLSCDLLGQEEILIEISKEFQSSIYVDQLSVPDCFQVISHIAPEIMTNDSSARFHVIGFPKLNERAARKFSEARNNNEQEPLFIRPSTYWYASHEDAENLSLTDAERDEFGVWHICYSMHSSRHELEWALRHLKPKWVVSTTPPCLAMDLAYVKKHCFKTRLEADDPIWNLFNLSSPEKCATIACASNGNSEVGECTNASKSIVEDSKPDRKRKICSPLKKQEVTLFGRARLGLEETQLWEREEEEGENGKKKCHVLTMEKDLELEIVSVEPFIEQPSSLPVNISLKDKELQVDREKMEMALNGNKNQGDRSIYINESLKKMYRSRNVPVPRPLPSLVELMSSTKRVRLVLNPVKEE
ncbi:DNA cross-link repair family protein [Rhynchospora pubera]|uniref:DNA cross-link repair family protein n=1 Tax=Rhynchospora pubera TaxID=906938 RepID=A0AAV8E5Y6_9POAL|nr:DNA cross-link repair family protein [Rhynchospora pubera]